MSDFSWSQRDFPDYNGSNQSIEDVEFNQLLNGVNEAENYAYHLQDALDIHDRIIEERMHETGYSREIENYLRDVGYDGDFEDPNNAAEWLTEQIALETWNLKNADPTAFPTRITGILREELKEEDYDVIGHFQERADIYVEREEAKQLRETLLDKKDYIEETIERTVSTGSEWEDRGKLGRFLFRIGVYDSLLETWPSEGYTEELSPDLKHWKLQDRQTS